MRTLAGIVLIALAVSVLAFAEEGNSPLPQPRRRTFAAESDRPNARPFALNARPFTLDEFRTSQGENVCYTMHTLVVARDKDSDTTRLLRQQTCTPSDRFRVNHSVQRQPALK